MRMLTNFILFTTVLATQANAQTSPGYQSRNFQYLTDVLTSGDNLSPVTKAWNAAYPPKYYTVSVTTTASNWLVKLQGSLDNSNWQDVAVTSSALGTVTNSAPLPMLYFRLNATTIAAGTSVTATAIAVP